MAMPFKFEKLFPSCGATEGCTRVRSSGCCVVAGTGVVPYFFTLVSHFGVLLEKAFGKSLYFQRGDGDEKYYLFIGCNFDEFGLR